MTALLRRFRFLGAMMAGVMNRLRVKGTLSLMLFSLLQGFIMLYSSRTEQVVTSFICYVAFGALYHFMVTVTCSEVAKYIRDESYGLVLGVNTFAALIIQTILTTIVVTKGTVKRIYIVYSFNCAKGVGFALRPRDQYFVYGCFHIVIAVIFIFIGLVVWFERSKE